MALEKFTLAMLSTMDDGRVREAFEQALKRCEDDCKDRAALKDSRKVTLVVEMKPLSDETGDLDSVNIEFKITDSVPKRTSKTYNMKSVRGGLLFNELSKEDIHQGTLDTVTGPREQKDAS